MSHSTANRLFLLLLIVSGVLVSSSAMAADHPIGKPMYITLPPDRGAMQAAARPTDPKTNRTMVWDNSCRMVDDPEGEARKVLLA